MAKATPKQLLKNEIRSYTRFLNKPDISEEARNTTNEKLAAATEALKTLEASAHEQETIKKVHKRYHHLKHIELQKVEKKIKSLQNKIESAELEEDKTKFKDELIDWENRLLYIEMFPPHMKYVSLFPKDDNEISSKKREEIFSMILGDKADPQNIKKSAKIVAEMKVKAAELVEKKRDKVAQETRETALKLQEHFYAKQSEHLSREDLETAIARQKAFITATDDIDQPKRKQEDKLDPFFDFVDENEEQKSLELVDFQEARPGTKKFITNKQRTYQIQKEGAQSLNEKSTYGAPKKSIHHKKA